jgi:4-amino-4-deoxy-L-arabinose transferase-like glycosyltransferase
MKKQTFSKAFLIILCLTFVLRLAFAFGFHEIWWDSGVYIGMGKTIFSGGESGLYEHIRPPLVPLVLGSFWSLGLDPALFGRLFEIALMLGIVILTYLLAKEWFNEKIALLSSLIISISPIFFYLSFHQYTEIPSAFFALLALFLLVRKKYIWSGISVGLCFLSKFPAGIMLVVIGLFLLIHKQWKEGLLVGLGFSLPVIPYFISNWIYFGSPIEPLLAAQDAINRALGCNVIRAQPWWQYFNWLIFSETKLHLFSIVGGFDLIKNWNKKWTLFVLCLLVPFLYFLPLSCRDYRYLTLFLPFFAMLTSLGVVYLFEKITKKDKWFYVLVLVLFLWMAHTTWLFYHANERAAYNPAEEQYFNYDFAINKEIWTSNPIHAAYSDAKLHKLYYPIYDGELAGDFFDYLQKNPDKIGAVALDNCGGGIICPPNDAICEQRTQQALSYLDSTMNRTLDLQYGRCWYKIWTTSS